VHVEHGGVSINKQYSTVHCGNANLCNSSIPQCFPSNSLVLV